MGAFATDQTICHEDHRQLEAAATGDLESLVAVCRRFELSLLAAAMRATVGVAAAFPLVEPTLAALWAQMFNSGGRWGGSAPQEMRNQSSASRF